MPYQYDHTMTELVPTIDEIVKYGLQANIPASDKEKLLEQHLIRIYALYFDIQYTFDETDFPAFDKSQLPDIRRNVESNFQDFGLYKTHQDILELDSLEDTSIGDAIDDLLDIITDLLEIKWRIEHHSWADGLWFFVFIFKSHTQQHILNVLNYMKQKNG